ncbi:MAG: D-alanyl-D-alanine carboxypeptidase/D-alanyl-D-alanine-endopeptidase [Candidatus Protistobacter heckmanni]|nr:D-alanyl-D-alanine carboxypeptidase/D-alanyl-D-alanine-endopeptidase [Candidatus Protistobacter heckmanni]
MAAFSPALGAVPRPALLSVLLWALLAAGAARAQDPVATGAVSAPPASGAAAAPAPSSALAAAPSAEEPATLKVALRKAHLPTDGLSIYVQKLGEDKPRLALNADRPMNPASTMKLVTTWSGLKLLGPNWRWKTNVYAASLPVGGVLRDKLYIRGTGDPKLIPEEMAKLVQELRGKGVDTIDGLMVLDKSEFVSLQPEGYSLDGETSRAYNVAPDPLLYSFKALTFTLNTDGKSVSVAATPPLAQLKLDNHMRPTPGRCVDWRRNVKVEKQPDGTLLADFGGPYPRGCGEQIWNVALLDHSEFFWSGFVASWTAGGGKFTAPPALAIGRVPADAKLLVSHESQPLAEIVRDINKQSNNVMARQLFLTIGAQLGGVPSNEPVTGQALKRWLAGQQLDFPELQLDNGSGLSRDERISARDMGRLLLRAAQGAEAQAFADSLPVAGVDGTMRHRMTRTPVAGNAQIKTGTLNNVRAIVGYVTDQKGERYVVASMINDMRAGGAQAVHDALLTWIYAGARPEAAPGVQAGKQTAKPAEAAKRMPRKRKPGPRT